MVPNMLVLASFFLGATAELEAPKLGGLALRLFNDAEADSTFEEEFLETRRRLADNTQPGSPTYKYTSCTPMWQKKNLWMDRQHISFDYPTSHTDASKTALRGFRMNTPTDNFRCDSNKNLRFKVTGLPGKKTKVDSNQVKRTNWQDGADGNIVYFDRHFIDCNPMGSNVPRVLTSLVLETRTFSNNKMRFKYTCGKSTSSVKLDKPAWWGRQNENIHWKNTGGWKDAGNHNAGLEYLDRHPILCPVNEAIAQIKFSGTYRSKGLNSGNHEFKVQYRCILVQ